jgi:cobalamin biosynthesis protein CobD/CbiB
VFLKGLKAIAIASALSTALSVAFLYAGICKNPNWWISLVFFIGLYFIINLAFNFNTDPQSSSTLLFGVVFLKLIILFLAVLVYSLVDRKGLLSFSAHFMGHYILFTVFEMRYLLSVIKNKYSQTDHTSST